MAAKTKHFEAILTLNMFYMTYEFNNTYFLGIFYIKLPMKRALELQKYDRFHFETSYLGRRDVLQGKKKKKKQNVIMISLPSPARQSP